MMCRRSIFLEEDGIILEDNVYLLDGETCKIINEKLIFSDFSYDKETISLEECIYYKINEKDCFFCNSKLYFESEANVGLYRRMCGEPTQSPEFQI